MHLPLVLADVGSSLAAVAIFGAAAVSLGFAFTRSARQRAKITRVRERGGLGSEPGPIGSSPTIADAGLMAQEELLGALRIAASDKLDDDGTPDFAAPLGLTLLPGVSASGGAARPQVMYGKRHGHQVFLREGNVGNALSPGFAMRKYRAVTLVRVAAPAFEWEAREGRLEPSAEAPVEIRDFLSSLAESPDVWYELRGVAGPEGIGLSRSANDAAITGWIFDLWLLERMASVLGAAALKHARLGRDWKMPYGLTDWKPSLREAVR